MLRGVTLIRPQQEIFFAPAHSQEVGIQGGRQYHVLGRLCSLLLESIDFPAARIVNAAYRDYSGNTDKPQ
jgi:hypothetical protein